MKKSIQIDRLFFVPPLAVARIGGSDTPLESFEWVPNLDSHGGNRTTIHPAVSLDVGEDGSIQPYLPSIIRFRDNGQLRPAAPFFELWARLTWQEEGQPQPREEEVPVTTALLAQVGASLDNVSYNITVANRKAQRRTGSAACAFIARKEVAGRDLKRHRLEAFSPHDPGEQPLVSPERPIPLGAFQVMRSRKGVDMGVDLDVLRVRFTPARGEVYGPPTADQGHASPLTPGSTLPPKTQGGRLHMIVKPENRILNPGTPWSRYVMDEPGQTDPQPSDSYDGADTGNNQSWGVVDDTCDGIIEARVVIGGRRLLAHARVFSSVPDFAPDRRPIYSLLDDLEDRELNGPIEVNADNFEQVMQEVVMLFHRIFEVAEGMNLDAIRYRGLMGNVEMPSTQNSEGLPRTDAGSMSREDKGYVDKISDLTSQEAMPSFTTSKDADALPYTLAARQVHGPLMDQDTLVDFFRERREHVKRLLRPPYGRINELEERPRSVPNPHFRDPRVPRDILHDMRMPPYMRDSDESALSLTWRQHRLLLALLNYVNSQGFELRLQRRVASVLVQLKEPKVPVL